MEVLLCPSGFCFWDDALTEREYAPNFTFLNPSSFLGVFGGRMSQKLLNAQMKHDL